MQTPERTPCAPTWRLTGTTFGIVAMAVSLCVQAEPPPLLYRQVAARYGLSAEALYAQAIRYAGRQSRFASAPTPWPWTVRLCQHERCETVFADDRATLAAILKTASRAGWTLYVGPLGLPWSPQSALPLDAATSPRVSVNAAVRRWVRAQGARTEIDPDSPTRVTAGRHARSARARRWFGLIDRVAREEGVDPALVRAVVAVESAHDPAAVSPKGAAGLMQLMPATAARFGLTPAERFDAAKNIRAGIRYLKVLSRLFGGDLDLILAGYNAGEGAVLKYGRRIPPYRETQTYVRRVKGYYARYRQRARHRQTRTLMAQADERRQRLRARADQRDREPSRERSLMGAGE